MFIADLHIHSKYSRATSKDCVPEMLALWARRKGLDLIGTGDFTHALWRQELKEKLVPRGDGLYALKPEIAREDATARANGESRFIVSGEISSIYKKNGKVRKVHNVILLPGLEEAETLSRRLEKIGNLHSDGRPILGLDSRDLLEITLEVCEDAIFIPAHIWTPHFSVLGAYSGFDNISECFEDLTDHIYALETGLSSNPPMNWRLSMLDRFALVSNSDAHSPGNLAREANLFDTELSYGHILRALQNPGDGRFAGTVEFFPEEGKYHLDGHRNCNVCQSPTETVAANGKCPVCGGRITVGVLHRVEALADREEGFVPPGARRFESLVPLPEVIAASTGFSPTSIKGRAVYERLLAEIGPELYVLREALAEEISSVAGPAMAEGIRRLRCGEVDVRPGYDGEYGRVSILSADEIAEASGQTSFFLGEIKPRKAAAKASKLPVPPKGQQIQAVPARQDSLNPRQEQAAFSNAPVTAVIAGPGTGKTKTLVARIAYLVEQCGIAPDRITAVTFTNKAAGEMRGRLEQRLGGARAIKTMTIGTFHAICLRLLRQSGMERAILDGAASKAIVEEVIAELALKVSPRDALRDISLRKCGAVPADESVLPEGLYEAYCDRVCSYGAMDYDDILLEALAMEHSATDVRFSCLLVDEFQDMNPVQYQLMQKWAKGGQSLFVIGDPNQSIYGFRGSDPRCFSWLREDFPALREITLTQNYRSTREILDASTPIVQRQSEVETSLRAERGSGAKVRVADADSAFSEALFVAKEIGRMVGGMDMLDTGAPSAGDKLRAFSDIAVLYRTNRQAAVLEECLAKDGVPYVVAGRDDFLSHPETVLALSFFRLLLNPADMLSLEICLRAQSGATPEQVRAALSRCRRADQTLAAIGKALAKDAVAAPLLEQIARYGQAVRKDKPQKLMSRWIASRPAGETDWQDKLLRMAVFHDTMEDLLKTAVLGQEGDIRRHGGKRYTADAVSLMTLHGSKGLEFPVVFLCGVADGLIPHKAHGGTPSSPEEERRLLYVGMTRARDELILSHSGMASPFLADVPDNLLAKGSVPRRKAGPEVRQYTLFE